MSVYEPELGQMMFGQPAFEHKVPDIYESALSFLSEELERVLKALGERSCDPFGNTGDAFKCPEFGVWSYSWGDEEQPYNFYHKKTGTAIRWYKYLGRGMSASAPLDPKQAGRMLRHCIAVCWFVESGAMKYASGGIHEISYFSTAEGEK